LVSTVPKDVIGLGQSLYIVGWANPPQPISGGIFDNFTFTLTKPDGSKITHIETSDSPATASFSYTVDQIGTWEVTLSWPGDRWHEAATSPPWKVLVQNDPVPLYPNEPLPTANTPWQWPVSNEYREWYQITGAWPMAWSDSGGSNWNQYSKAPNTAHILWMKQMSVEGPVGQLGWSGLSGSAPAMVAVSGRLFYVQVEPDASNVRHHVLYSLDQKTGEQIYKTVLPGTGTGGNIFLEISPRIKIDPTIAESEGGVISLWVVGGGGLWEVNPWTGVTSYYLSGSFSSAMGGASAPLYWNGLLILSGYPKSGQLAAFDTRAKEIVWNKTLGSPYDIDQSTGLMTYQTRPTGGVPSNAYITTYSALTGELVVNGSSNPVDGYNPQRMVTSAYGYKWSGTSDGRMHAFNLATGKWDWTSEPSNLPWGAYFTYQGASGYENYYQGCWDGYMRAYDVKTGKINWAFFCGNSTETAMGSLVPWGQPVVADGKIYFTTCEHTAPTPLPRGNKLFCLNAITGEYLWSIPMMAGSRGISSGMMWSSNTYDGGFYMFGKGESKVTVSAPQTAAPSGTSVLIQGTVTDQSTGAKDTPAVSDASQETWMEYLYQNKPMPNDASGVPVVLKAQRSDGSQIDIAQVVSDKLGHYEFAWTPPTAGTYKILATFDGTESYYSSQAETSLAVSAATPAPTPTPTSNVATFDQLQTTNMYVIAVGLVLIVLVIVAIVFLVRKRQ